MPFQVYRVKSADRAKMDEAMNDDVLSRQSLVIRDARQFGEAGDGLLLFVEGAEAGVARADALLLAFAERAPNAAELHRKLKDEEDDAASGLGSIFG
jgi:hypothetical protein